MGIEGRDGRAYYSYEPHPAWRFLVLDSFDLSVIGWPAGSPEHEASKALLLSHNKNEVGVGECRWRCACMTRAAGLC